MKEKRPSPVMRLLQWAGPERKWLILSVLCAFGSGILVITSYIGIYRLMDAVLSGRVRCMVTEHLAKVSLGALDERSTGAVKTVLNEDIEKLELFLAHNLPEFVAYLTGPVVIFLYLLSVNAPLALVSLIPLPLAGIVMAAGCDFPVSALRQCPSGPGLPDPAAPGRHCDGGHLPKNEGGFVRCQPLLGRL